MTKKNRIRRIWQRNKNADFFVTKGVYFCLDKTIKNFHTAKDVVRILRKGKLKQYGMPFETAYKKGLIKDIFSS